MVLIPIGRLEKGLLAEVERYGNHGIAHARAYESGFTYPKTEDLLSRIITPESQPAYVWIKKRQTHKSMKYPLGQRAPTLVFASRNIADRLIPAHAEEIDPKKELRTIEYSMLGITPRYK